MVSVFRVVISTVSHISHNVLQSFRILQSHFIAKSVSVSFPCGKYTTTESISLRKTSEIIDPNHDLTQPCQPDHGTECYIQSFLKTPGAVTPPLPWAPSNIFSCFLKFFLISNQWKNIEIKPFTLSADWGWGRVGVC